MTVITEMRHMEKQGKTFLKKDACERIFNLNKYWLDEENNLKNDVCSRHSHITVVMCRHASVILEGSGPKFLKGRNRIGIDTYIVELLFLKHILLWIKPVQTHNFGHEF